MNKNVILVDTENVGTEALQGLNCLKGTESEIVFFASSNSKPMSAQFLFELQQTGVVLRWELIEEDVKEKNSMDFHIVCYLALCTKDADDTGCRYFILSRDKGFINPCKYLSKKLSKSISNIPTLAQVLDCNKISAAQNEIDTVVYKCKQQAVAPVEFHRLLQINLNHKFTTNQIAEIYWQHKQDFTDNYMHSVKSA